MRKKTSKTVQRRSGSIASVVWLTDRRSLGTRMHGEQLGSAEILAFPFERLHERRPRRRRDAFPVPPLLDCRPVLTNVGSHFSERGPGFENVFESAHTGEYASDELSVQYPTMIPMTAEAANPTIRPMGRGVTPARFRADMAKRLRAARTMAGITTQKEAADLLGVGLDSYETWERGRTPVPAQYVSAVCALYRIDANFLFDTAPMPVSRSAREIG